jgi:hypothetical protein
MALRPGAQLSGECTPGETCVTRLTFLAKNRL